MIKLPSYIKETQSGIVVQIRVQPGSAGSKVIGPEGDQIKIKLHAPPVLGAANKELVQILKKLLKIPKKNIQILHGEKSRNKRVEIKGITCKEFLTAVLSPH